MSHTKERSNIRKLAFIVTIVIAASLFIPLVSARSSASLSVWPVGSVHTGDPIVTTSPATLMVYSNDPVHVPVNPVWVLLVTNEATYDHLISVTTNTSVTFLKSDFTNKVDYGKIPPRSKYSYVPGMPGVRWRDLFPGYPGCEISNQYGVGSVKDKLDIPRGDDIWWSVMDLNIAPLTNAPKTFTITANMDDGAEDLRILVLVLGNLDRCNWYYGSNKLDVRSPYTRSTLLVAPEAATVVLALAPLSAYGLYRVRHKLKRK